MFTYTINSIDQHAEVSLRGDLDIDGTHVVDELLISELGKYNKVELNFESVPFVDSTGMGLLMNMTQTLKKQDIHVTISNVNEDIMEVFELIQLPEILGEEVFI